MVYCILYTEKKQALRPPEYRYAKTYSLTSYPYILMMPAVQHMFLDILSLLSLIAHTQCDRENTKSLF